MAGKTYVTKGYSTHTNIPDLQHGYDHGPKNPGNQYVVETKTIKQYILKPAAEFTDFVGSPSKAELLNEYVHAPSMSKTPKYASPAPGFEPNYELNYENSSPPKYHGQEALKKSPNQSSWPMKTSGFSTQNKYRLSNPVHGYPSEEAHLIHSGPDMEEAKYVQNRNISGPNISWQTAGLPATRHPLTTPSNNINEALGFFEESIHYSPRADPRRRGVLDDLSTRAQPIEPLKRYARPVFVAKPNDAHQNFSNTGSTINSHEATRRYRDSFMP
ncbi:hypothetical protein L6452_13082 [Arctium lappa]|uniref:Uncharacterized protein n=1 Tax=Arctium lappa TaxID=4217 RepID=A0ACB9CH60_ARCLA|nr:hypothetical protein L6452_13082 [Arctium lappa]